MTEDVDCFELLITGILEYRFSCRPSIILKKKKKEVIMLHLCTRYRSESSSPNRRLESRGETHNLINGGP